MSKYEVRGFDQHDNVVFHVAVEAPNEHVARLYACVHLERTAYGAEAVRSAIWSEALVRAA
jgi:hypothetical protein